MTSIFPKTTDILTKEWKLLSALDLGWSSDGDTLQDLHNRSNGSFDLESCYRYQQGQYIKVDSTDLIDPLNGYWIKKSTSETVFRSELITLTAFFSQLTHYDQTINTANGFLYKISGDTYLVTTAHLILDTPQSIESQIATLVKSDTRDTLTLYCYSRYYDVAVFKVSDITNLNSLSVFNNYSNSIPEHVRVNYLDPNTGNTIKASAKYFNIVQAPIELGAVGHKLIRGASGSAVTDIRGQLIGMVSSCRDDYDNMSLCIPAATIYNIISNYNQGSANGELNFDLTNRIYPGIVTQPLQPGHLVTLPSSITSGELVTLSDNHNLKPFDIVTHIKINNNWIAVGKDKNLSSIILDNQSQTTFDLKVQQCKQSWRNAFGTLPRKILGRKAEKTFSETGSKIYPSLVPIMYVDYPISANNGSKVTLNTAGIPFESSVIREGMSAKILDAQDVTDQHYYSIMSIDYGDNVSEVTLDRDVSKLIVSKLRIYLLSGNYYYHSTTIDDQTLTDSERNHISEWISLEIEKEDPNTSTLTTGIIEIDQYIILVISHLVRYWAFLVLSQLQSIPQGHQQIVWAKECERLTTILYQFLKKDIDGSSLLDLNEVIFDRCLIYVYLKLIEFVDYQLVMLTSIFLLNWYNNIFTKAGFAYQDSYYFDLINSVFNGNMKLNVTSTHKIYNNLLELNGILFDQNKKMKTNPDLIRGYTTHNTDGYSREFRNMKSAISQLKPVVMDQDYNSRELELVYEELLNLNAGDLQFDSLSNVKSYYFKSFGIMKSFWDHANQNLGNIISAMRNEDIYEEKVVEVTTESMPPKLDTWHFRRLLTRSLAGC